MGTSRKPTDLELAWRQTDNIVNPFLSPEEDAKLVEMFRKNPAPFIEKYLKINTKDGSIKNFKLKRSQRIVNEIIQKYRAKKKPVRLIILKARQVGISTYLEALIFWRMRFWRHTDARIVSFENGSATKIFNMTELYYESLPTELRPPKYRRTKGMLVMGNPDETTRLYHPGLMSGVEIGTAKNVHIGRGSHYQCVHGTEVALWPDAYATTRSILQCVPSEPETYAFVESTSDGADGYFYDEFMRAREALHDSGGDGTPEWFPVFLPYWMDEGYEDGLTDEEALEIAESADEYEKWLKNKFKNITWGHISWRRRVMSEKCQGVKTTFDLEYAPTIDEAFSASGQSVFDKESLIWYKSNTVKSGTVGRLVVPDGGMIRRPYFVEDPDGYLTIWEHPQEGMLYGLGCDAALGTEANESIDKTESSAAEIGERDYCAGIVLSANMKQVAQYNSRVISAHDFGDEMANLGAYYNTALLMPETGPQGAGYAIQKRLKDLQYPLIGRWEKVDSITNNKSTGALGWEINFKTKQILIADMQREIKRGAGRLSTRTTIDERSRPKLSIRSIELLRQLQVFANLAGGGVGAKKGSHDDLVIALGLSIKALEQMGAMYMSPPSQEDPEKDWIDEWADDKSFWEV